MDPLTIFAKQKWRDDKRERGALQKWRDDNDRERRRSLDLGIASRGGMTVMSVGYDNDWCSSLPLFSQERLYKEGMIKVIITYQTP